MEIKKKKKDKGIIYILLNMLIGAIFGGGAMMIFGDKLYLIGDFNKKFQELVYKNSYNIFIVFIIIMVLLGLVTYVVGKRKFLESALREDEIYDEKFLGINITLMSINIMLSTIFIGIFIQTLIIYDDFSKIKICLALYILNGVFHAVMIKKNISVIKKVYLEKKGNPYDFKFAKDWMNSLDEREKIETYYAGFKAYTSLNKLIFIIIFALIIIGMAIEIQIITYVILILIVLVGNLTYLYYSDSNDKNIL